MDENDLLQRACDTNFAYVALGNRSFEAHGASFVVNPATPRRHTANSIGKVRTSSAEDIETLLQRAEIEFSKSPDRAWSIDGLTPPKVAARLALEQGYKPNDNLVLALQGDLKLPVRSGGQTQQIEIREVLSEDDWAAYRELDAMWWVESGIGYFGPYDASLHDEFMLDRRLKAPRARGWFACVDDIPRAFFTSWPGDNGVGIVEDLYCHPQYRHLGLATALITCCVADCRARGAGPVIINADVNDTPKQMYAAMGFRPLFVHRVYTRREEQKDAPA
jgi:GNAT superfamily N-acetyltransferase